MNDDMDQRLDALTARINAVNVKVTGVLAEVREWRAEFERDTQTFRASLAAPAEEKEVWVYDCEYWDNGHGQREHAPHCKCVRRRLNPPVGETR